MPDFTVHVDRDELLAAGLSRPTTTDRSAPRPAAAHHGAQDGRQAARRQSERAHAGRAAGAASARSYAFRRS